MNDNVINLKIAPISLTGGMAGSKRLMNLVQFLKEYQDVNIENIIVSDKAYLPGHGIKVKQIKQKSKLIGNLSLYRYLKKSSDKCMVLYYYGQPDIINFFLFFLLRKKGIKIIFDIVEDYSTYTNFTNTFNKWNIRSSMLLLSKLSLIANGIIVINNYLYKRIIKITKNKLPIIKLPVSINKHDFSTQNKVQSDTLKVFYGGAFVYKDGVRELIEAFSEISVTNPNIRLILTGKGMEKDITQINELLSKLGNKQINFLGYVSDEQYFKLIKSCDILCMPRKNIPFAIAGFPFKLGEYLGTGNAVLSSSIGELPEMFNHDEICFYDPDNEYDLRDKLKNLLKDSFYRKSLGIKGREKAFELFNSENHALILYKFILELTKE